MPFNLLVALIVLPLLGALIAWAGDVIGYRLGKSRRSLFGLRPRATARLVGVVVGALLPLAGLGFAMAVSQDARDAVLRIRQLRQQAITLTRDNQALNAERERARGEAVQARKRARDADLNRVEAERHLAQTEQRLTSSQALLRTAQASLRTTQTSLSTAKSDLSKARGDLTKARGDLTKARGDLTKAKGDLTKAKADLNKAKGDLTETQSDLAKTEGHLATTRDDLASAEKKMQSMNAELENLDTVERHVAVVEERLNTLETRLAETQQTLERYKFAARAIIEQDVGFEPGDEIIRAIVESGRTQDQLEAILTELLKYASAAAARHGIAPGPTGRAVRIVSPIPPEMRLSRVRETDITSEVASQIRQGDAPTYVVIVRAWGRAFENQAEPMAAEFWAAPNKVTFRAGEEIFAATIDGSMPRGHVFRALWQTVANIRMIAARRGILPSPKTGHYGEVPAEELLEALDQILDIGGPATLRIVVTDDTRVAQPEEAPMRVRLDVTRAESE